MAVELPLFPLNAVLFPHMRMSLHIFEERYLAMLRDCNDAGTTFGVVAIREGLEVGGPAVPHAVGTLALLDKVIGNDDGTYDLRVVGASRFAVESFSFTHPYLSGRIRYLQDDAAPLDDAEALAERVLRAYAMYTVRMRELGMDTNDEPLPEEPERLSYVVSAGLQVETARRQELLELDSAAARLRRILQLLRRESLLLHEMSQAQERRRSAASLN
jgi:Lon protease-like protein